VSVIRPSLPQSASKRLEWGRHEDAHHVNALDAHVHATIERFPPREIRGHNNRAVLCGDNQPRWAATCRHNLSHALHRCAVHVMAALLGVPTMSACRRPPGEHRANKSMQSEESSEKDNAPVRLMASQGRSPRRVEVGTAEGKQPVRHSSKCPEPQQKDLSPYPVAMRLHVRETERRNRQAIVSAP
jgi:hypothetical protein